MPIYDYECANCRRRFEVVHGVHVPGPTECPLCGGGPVRKAISAPAVHFKGSGWAKKERRAAAPAAKKDAADAGKGSEDGAAATAPTKAATSDASDTSSSGSSSSGSSSSGSSSSGGASSTGDSGGD